MLTLPIVTTQLSVATIHWLYCKSHAKKSLYSDCHILFSMNLAHNVVQDFRQSGVDVYCVGKLLCSGSKVDKS